MTGVAIKAQVELRPWLSVMNALGKDQIPFATAKTLTALAKDSQLAVQRTMPSRFKLRNRAFPKVAIKIVAARKRDWPRQVAVVGSPFASLALQETGGIKRSRSGGALAIPTSKVRRGARGVALGNRPRSQIRSGKARVTEDSRSIVRVFKRKHKQPTPVLFLLRSRARVRPRLGFDATVKRVVRSRAQLIFDFELKKGLRR